MGNRHESPHGREMLPYTACEILTKHEATAPKCRNPLKRMERAKGFEPSTSTLARLRSTPELRPLASLGGPIHTPELKTPAPKARDNN